MAMFYFDVVAADGLILRDDAGVDLPDVESAKSEACKDAMAIAFERGPAHGRATVKVRDGQRDLFTVSVHHVVVVDIH